ncbi:hypothetical protein QA584_08290 [Anaerocolumna sp. AGMB13025]|uniref:hypothetical protein n=1 Tax=Anaerocolumna sp. AGMB13025 TaxID=3039116 RepID=UPI00241EF4E9|nr:hypothetical protein [Anaerocolumna sp. AGMB13025]WFR59070.1 hypothetical protein QA584_08290 [Anaerocolumna sp. AGMB13025]
MKKNNNLKTKLYGLCFCLLVIASLSPAVTAKADISPNYEIPITYTSSVDNLQYPATNQFTAVTGISGVGKVVINKPTVIKAYMNWDTAEVNSSVIWFSRDVKGIDLVGAQVKLTSEKNYELLLLDAGTYYFNYALKANNNNKNSYYFTTVGVCLVGQYANSTEQVNESSKNNPNSIKFGKVETGFLSITAPIDYYRFEIKEKSIITVNFNFLELKDINIKDSKCILKNSMNANVIVQSYSTRGAEYNTFTKILDPGVYYITMEGSTTITSLEVKKVSYKIQAKKSTEAFTNKNVKITLKVPFEYSEILVTKAKVSKADITDYSTWNTYRSDKTKELSDTTYTVTANGTYTFRVRDYLKNYNLYVVDIDNIDKTAPVILGVKNKKTYKSPVTITFYDKLSGVNTAKLNKKTIKDGTKVSAKGTYTLIVTDAVGNSKTVKFTIK